MTFNLKADAQPGRGQKKASTPSTRGRGHATEQDCKSETGTVQLRMNPMPLPLRHGRARGACRPRGIMSGSRRPPCRITPTGGAFDLPGFGCERMDSWWYSPGKGKEETRAKRRLLIASLSGSK